MDNQDPNLKRAVTAPPNANLAQRVRHSSFIKGFQYAFTGIGYCFRTQVNFRVHIAITILAILLGVFLSISWLEWSIIATIVVLVLAAEMVNTMVESLVDLVTQQYHPLAKIAKDVAAGVVLLTAIGAVVVGLLIFLPRLWAALHL